MMFLPFSRFPTDFESEELLLSLTYNEPRPSSPPPTSAAAGSAKKQPLTKNISGGQVPPPVSHISFLVFSLKKV